MHYWTDLYLHLDASDEAIARAIGTALHVASGRIAVHQVLSPETNMAWDRPGLYALVQRDDLLSAEERDPLFPVKLMIVLRQDVPAIDDHLAIGSVARALGQPVLSDSAEDGEDVWRLYWPDTTSTPVTLDDDGHFTLKEVHRTRLDAYRHVAA